RLDAARPVRLNEAAEFWGGSARDMPIEGRGRIAVWEGASLWVLAAARETGGTDYHAHHAIQVTLSLEGDFELRTETERLTGPAVAVASGVRHIFKAHGMVAFLFI